ncbi:MAG: sugar transferase, partial [Chloroflexi bacterium]|nr:sugar transferase [Chloroflexota bacterium]
MSGYKAVHRPIFWRLKQGERKTLLFIGDLLAILLSIFIAFYFWAVQDNFFDFGAAFVRERIPNWFYLLPVFWMLLMVEQYDLRRASRRKETFTGIGIAALVTLGIYLLVFFVAEKGTLPRLGVAIFIISASLLTMGWRFAYINIFTAPLLLRRVIIVGAGRAGSTLARIVSGIWPPPFFVIGLIDDDPEKSGEMIENFTVLGGCERLLELIEAEEVSDLVLAISGRMSPEMFQAMIDAEEQGITVKTMPVIYEELLGRVPIFLLQSDWILRSFFDHVDAGEFYEMTKRLIDIFGGLLGTLVLIPLAPIISLAIVIDSGLPILYSQERMGKNGRLYRILKFRTMCQDAEKDGKARPAVENDQRVTKVGKILRKSHLDELPQFFNVLRGDMSLVGPRAERPELVDSLQTRVPFYRARLLVKPGLTGWAQVNYGYASTVEETGIKLEYDLFYIKHRNLALDFNIL